MKGIRQKKNWTEAYSQVNSSIEDLAVLFDFYKAGEMEETEVDQHYRQSLNLLEDLEFKNMLSAEEEHLSAIININAGDRKSTRLNSSHT